MNKKNNRKGFTTVELVIVIAVIAILATALIPTFGGLINSANDTKAMTDARQQFNDYMLADAAKASSGTYYIVAEGKYFEVSNGKLETKPETTNPDTTKCTVGVLTKADNGTFSITYGATHGEDVHSNTSCTNDPCNDSTHFTCKDCGKKAN